MRRNEIDDVYEEKIAGWDEALILAPGWTL